jgi:hypothetical protein
MQVNADRNHCPVHAISIGDLIDHYVQTDLSVQAGWHSHATRTIYRYFRKRWTHPHWGEVALHRHKRHISKVLVVAREAAVIVNADTLLDQVKNLLAQAERLTESAERSGSLDTALRGIGQVRSVLQLLGEVSGQLAGKGTNIAIGINAGGASAVPNFRSMSDQELKQFLQAKGHHLTLEA